MKTTSGSPENIALDYSGNSIAKSTIYNLLGYGVPMLFALVLIPSLLKGLGVERFGILNLAWIVLGYVSFFDFGIGKSLTKIVAEKIGLNQNNEIPKIFWTSLILMLAISLLITLGVIIFLPTLVNNFFTVSRKMQSETLDIFILLAISIPIISTTAGLRGVLEAYQQFGIVNFIRVFLGIFTFLGPLIILMLINSLFWIVFFLIIIRVVVWFLYLFQCFKINREIKSEIKFDFNSVRSLVKFSLWITVANIIGPLMLYSDRFIIGALISAEAITYYATPYEIITKLLLIPGSIIGVLFPVFSASFFSNPILSKKLFFRGTKFVFLIIFPLVLLSISFSFEGLTLWLGEKFAENSSLILQFLAIGVLYNSIAYIPFNFFQGAGKPNVPALINLLEFPFYLLAIWIGAKHWNINGVAFFWSVRIFIDTALMFYIAFKLFDLKFSIKIITFVIFLTIITFLIPYLFTHLIIKGIFVAVFLMAFFLIAWNYILTEEEKMFLLTKIRKHD